MPAKKPLFDVTKAKQTIEKGRRSGWWVRRGGGSRGFYYMDAAGRRIAGEEHLDRIRSLVIPPAWKHVRVSPAAGSPIQAVGMDTTGRVQYLYHPKFSEKQQRKKFLRIEEFGKHLPKLRQITNKHITRDGVPREKVLAVMMRLINSLYFRVGTEKNARHYRTYGITTLKNKHLHIGRNGELIFDFVGKSHIQHRKVIVDDELAAAMREIKEVGRKGRLFHYLDADGKPQPVRPGDVNQYLKEATDPQFSSKDLRTWGGTLLAAVELAEFGAARIEAEQKKNIVRAVKKVAEQLGNTPAVCRSSYIHPKVLRSYEQGMTLDEFHPRANRRISRLQPDYETEERALMKLLKADRSN